MRWITAPLLGRRPVTEFSISGILEPEPETIDDREPGQWVFDRNSLPIVRTEWWFHPGSQFWFLVERNTMTDEITEVRLARGLTTELDTELDRESAIEMDSESSTKPANELAAPAEASTPTAGGSN